MCIRDRGTTAAGKEEAAFEAELEKIVKTSSQLELVFNKNKTIQEIRERRNDLVLVETKRADSDDEGDSENERDGQGETANDIIESLKTVNDKSKRYETLREVNDTLTFAASDSNLKRTSRSTTLTFLQTQWKKRKRYQNTDYRRRTDNWYDLKTSYTRINKRLLVKIYCTVLHLLKDGEFESLADCVEYDSVGGDDDSTGGVGDDNATDIQYFPLSVMKTLWNKSEQYRRRLETIADAFNPLTGDGYNGEENQYKEKNFIDFIYKNGSPFVQRYIKRMRKNNDHTHLDDLTISLQYLLYFAGFDMEMLIFYLKVLLSCEYPGEWAKVFFLIIGLSNAGKSVFTELFSDYASNSKTIGEIEDNSSKHRVELATLAETFVCINQEITKIPGIIKQIVSPSSITYVRKYSNSPSTVAAMAKLFLTANARPAIKDCVAIFKRAIIINTQQVVTKVKSSISAAYDWLSKYSKESLLELLKTRLGEEIVERERENLSNQRECLPFLYYEKKTKTYSNAQLLTNHIVRGWTVVTLYFSWFEYFQNLKIPVAITEKDLPVQIRRNKESLLNYTNAYTIWKHTYEIEEDDNERYLVAEEDVFASIKEFSEMNQHNMKVNINELFDQFKNCLLYTSRCV